MKGYGDSLKNTECWRICGSFMKVEHQEQGERQLEMEEGGSWRQINKYLCELMKWDFILWIRAPHSRLVEGHQGSLVPPSFACEILGTVYFLIVFSMEFVNQRFSATAVVDGP